MTSSSVQKWINSSLSEITNKKFANCTKVTNVEMKTLTDQAFTCASEIFRVTITLQCENGETKQVKGVFKKDPTLAGFDKFAKELAISDNEEMVYNKIIKPMEEILQDEEEYMWPECYLSKDRCLLLEDLCEQNYKCVSTSVLLDVPHAVMAMDAIGKYHALGLVLKQQGIIDITTLPENFHLKKTDVMMNLFTGSINKLIEITQNQWEPEWKPFGAKLKKALENVGDKLANLVKSTQGKCSVICHGDYTMRNIIFQYNDVRKQENPLRVKLLDFQLPNWSNLGLDLIMILAVSIFPQTREDNLDKFLQTYSSSLSANCAKYGYTGYVPTLSDVRESYESMSYLANLMTVTAIPTLVGAKDDFKIGEIMDEENTAFKASYFNNGPVQEAIKFQLKYALKHNIL